MQGRVSSHPEKWSDPGQGRLRNCMTYNLLYLLPEGVLTVLLLWPLLKTYDAAFPGRQGGGGAA